MASNPSKQGTFSLGNDGQYEYWAENCNGAVEIHRRSHGTETDAELVAQLNLESLRTLLIWAEEEKSVTFSLTGPLAQQVKDLSQELSLTPEMFVWHAVKVFIDLAPESNS